jgi:hypothetical protein
MIGTFPGKNTAPIAAIKNKDLMIGDLTIVVSSINNVCKMRVEQNLSQIIRIPCFLLFNNRYQYFHVPI